MACQRKGRFSGVTVIASVIGKWISRQRSMLRRRVARKSARARSVAFKLRAVELEIELELAAGWPLARGRQGTLPRVRCERHWC